jgi:threonine/homoserine/homoserine lactone efflux protein
MALYFYFFLKGLLAGITIAAIGGPVGILCVRRTMKEGLYSGIALGLGAALADALFGSISGFGLTFISDFLLTYQKIINIIGSVFLVYLGITTFLEHPQPYRSEKPFVKKRGLLKNMLTSFFITLTNPATILFFAALSIGLGIGLNYAAATWMIVGIFIGSLAWFSSLAFVITIFHTKITEKQLATMNKVFGIGLIGFGLFVGLKALLL